MSTNERIILDPAEVATSRHALDITPWVSEAGFDWGDAQVTAFMADRDRGSFPVDFSIPNRDVTGPLVFSKTIGGTTTTQARANIQAKIALFQREGGWVKRILNSGGTVYADIVDAATHGFSSAAGWESGQNADIDPTISLSCLPDFYQDEITLADNTESTASELTWTETEIDGDYPARVRIVVDDDQGANQRGLIWGFRSRYYDAASTAQLSYEAEALTVADSQAGVGAVTGASGGTAIAHLNLATNWTPTMTTDIAGVGPMTHTGTYRVFARVGATSGTAVQCRLVWDVGDLVNPTANESWRVAGPLPSLYVHDFGEVRLDAAPVGNVHRWQGQFQFRGDVGGELAAIDKMWMVPVDEGMGVLTAPVPAGWGANTYAARDEFNQGGSAAVTGKILPVGGTWTVAGTACDATDFTMTSGAASITRTAVSDTGTGASVMAGRGISAGTASYGAVQVGVDTYTDSFPSTLGFDQGAYARLVDTSNFVIAIITPIAAGSAAGGSPCLFGVYKIKAGATTTLSARPFTAFPLVWYSLVLNIDTAGVWAGFLNAGPGPNPDAVSASGVHQVVFGQDVDLAAGGTLASGKAGIVDYNSTATAASRQYDNFLVSQPLTDAVIFASQTAQLTSDGMFRIDSGGTAYGPVGKADGDLPRLPVTGLEGRTTEIFLKNSRGDFDQVPDAHTSTDSGDNISARIFYRPCYLNTGNI